VPFLGDHQPGIDTPAARFGLLAACNVVNADRGRPARSLRDLTDEARGLMEARRPERRDTAYPPTETGILGPEGRTDGLAVTLSVGASLFDDRFGLAERRPRELVRMPFLANDRLDPAQTHSDLLLALSADEPDVLLHALRQLMRRTRDNLVLHWMVDGYNRPDATPVPGRPDRQPQPARLQGRHRQPRHHRQGADGRAGLGRCRRRRARLGGGRQLPGGPHHPHVRRVLGPHAPERAAEAHRPGQGQRAPLGRDRETDDPGYEDDPTGRRVPLDAHIRMANPRTAETAGSRILRRGFNFSRGFDAAGRLDQGLVFLTSSPP
jgi:deferrochelatase/peroxidase EfeB